MCFCLHRLITHTRITTDVIKTIETPAASPPPIAIQLLDQPLVYICSTEVLEYLTVFVSSANVW